MRKEKGLRWFFTALIVVGLICIIGTAGRADTTDAALSSIVIQLIVSLGIVATGFCGLNVLAKK